MSGLKTHCLYALEPHKLGFCGPLNNKTASCLIRSYLEGKEVNLVSLRKTIRQFTAACHYYGLIAQKNYKKNLLSKEVVEAYWIGNDLLKKASFKAHHSWHVLKIGSLTGRVNLKGPLLDLCRVSWGRVKKIDKQLTVQYQPLNKKKNKYILGRLKIKKINFNKKFLRKIKIGDTISIHWNQAIEVLSQKQIDNLKRYTQKTLNNI